MATRGRGRPFAPLADVRMNRPQMSSRSITASIFKLRDGLLVDYTHISDGLSTALQMGARLTKPR